MALCRLYLLKRAHCTLVYCQWLQQRATHKKENHMSILSMQCKTIIEQDPSKDRDSKRTQQSGNSKNPIYWEQHTVSTVGRLPNTMYITSPGIWFPDGIKEHAFSHNKATHFEPSVPRKYHPQSLGRWLPSLSATLQIWIEVLPPLLTPCCQAHMMAGSNTRCNAALPQIGNQTMCQFNSNELGSTLGTWPLQKMRWLKIKNSLAPGLDVASL